ncbi:MAG: type IV pili methyl-accepting chemotaxis transducer N-terminal domain-containing protein [Paracoccaceae bacterium]
MRINLRSVLAISAISLITFVSAAVAQDAKIIPVAIVSDESPKERIAYSGKLRMLTQRIPSAACALSSGIDPNGSAKLLNESIVEFEKILSALEFGDGDLKIQSAETRRMTIEKIHETREIWMPFKEAATALVSGATSTDNLQFLLDENLAVLGSAQTLVSELVEQYSTSPTTVQAELFLIDIAGRQRMLTQKMSKESCMITTGTGTADTVEALQSTMQMFELSLEALRFGMPELGIRKPPTPAISEGLGEVLVEWEAVKPLLDSALAGEKLDADLSTQKFQALNITMAKMNEVVIMYAEASDKKI